MSPRPDVSEERKAQILQAAMKVAARKGYASARMDEVAQEAGLSVGILYWYFKGKVEITLALMDLFFAPDVTALKSALNAAGSSRERLWKLFAQNLEDESSALALALWMDLYHQASHEPKVRKKLLGYLAQYRDLTAQIIEQGSKRGELCSTIDPQAAALTLQALFDGYMTYLILKPKLPNLGESLKQSFDLLFDGLKP